MAEVYCVTSPSGRRYVGWSSRGSRKRWYGHASDAKRGGSTPLQRAIRKYGTGAFTHVVIARPKTESQAKALEMQWISWLNTYERGYNATLGGDGACGYPMHRTAGFTGRKHSPETRKLMSERGRGRVKSPEHRAKIAATHTGMRRSEASRLKQGESRRRMFAERRAR